MSVWKNLFTAVKGHVNTTAESIEDGQILTILDQQIREANTALASAKDERAKMVAKRNLKQKTIDDTNAEITRLMSGAKKAKDSGDMALAKEAMERVIKLEGELSDHQALLDQFKSGADQMEISIKQTENKLEALKRKVESAKANEALLAAQRAASTSSRATNGKLAGAVDSLNRLEQRQAEQAALLEANDEFASELAGDELEKKLAQFDNPAGSSVDDRLANL